MKSTTVLFVIALVIHHTWGVFDGRNPGTGPRPGDKFPVNGTLLQCAGEEPGQALIVGLNVTRPGDVFKPLTSGYGHSYDVIYAHVYYLYISLVECTTSFIIQKVAMRSKVTTEIVVHGNKLTITIVSII